MTRSSTKELFTPFKDPEQEFFLSRMLFKTLNLDESISPMFDLISDLEENSEEEVTETMSETMEEYMSKTQADYGSGVTRPKIDDKDHFELKGQFLKEHRDNTFSGSDLKAKFLSKYCPPARTAKKIEEINNFQQEPDETLYQAWEGFKELLMKCPQHYLMEMQEVILFYNGLEVLTRQILDSKGAIPTKTVADAKVAVEEMVGCELCKGPHYTKDCPLKEEVKTLEEAYYIQFFVPFQQGRQYRATAPGFYQRNNANPSYQERRQSMEESLRKFMNESTKRHEENSNLIKEIRASTDAAIRNQGSSIKTLEIQIRQMSNVLHERGFGGLPSTIETNSRDHVKSISTTIKIETTLIRRIGSSQYAVSSQLNSKLMFKSRQATIPILSRLNGYYCNEKGSYRPQYLDSYSCGVTVHNDSLPQKEKDPGRASISVMPLSTYLNLGLGELAHTKLTVKLAYSMVKPPKGIAENVLVGIGKFIFLVDFIVLDMHEDVKVPLILGRPFLSTVHAKIYVFKRKITLRVGDEKIIFKSVKPASSLIKRVYVLSLRKRMELDLEARLIGETLVLNRSLDLLYRDYIKLNDLNVPLELRIDQVDDLRPTIEELR
nr:hypothetical protein [Tanacetum cinerariifolium]